MIEPRLGALAGATIVVSDLAAAIAAYADFLGYRGAPAAPVGKSQAAIWGCPAAAHAQSVTLYPESRERRFLRLVEGEVPGFAPSTTPGWTAVEIVVQDLDALADKLSRSPFEIVGPPATLDFDFTDKIRAMQVLGHGGAMLYLTEINGEIPGFELPPALSFVGQPFIMVLGGPSIDVTAAPYVERGGLLGPVLQARIDVLAQAQDQPFDRRYDLATIALADRSLIEVDAFPPALNPRPLSSVGLPAGIAMASFWGSDATVLTGSCGELIEIMQE